MCDIYFAQFRSNMYTAHKLMYECGIYIDSNVLYHRSFTLVRQWLVVTGVVKSCSFHTWHIMDRHHTQHHLYTFNVRLNSKVEQRERGGVGLKDKNDRRSIPFTPIKRDFFALSFWFVLSLFCCRQFSSLKNGVAKYFISNFHFTHEHSSQPPSSIPACSK